MTSQKDGLLNITLRSIGTIHTQHIHQDKTPIQPVYAKGIKGQVEINPEYLEGLRDLEGFSHIYLLYFLHKVKSEKLLVKPYLDDSIRGVFATRAPSRPNHLGLSLVKLIKIVENILHVEDIDILDQTPLLDIKPYILHFNPSENVKCGWIDNKDHERAQILGNRQKNKGGLHAL